MVQTLGIFHEAKSWSNHLRGKKSWSKGHVVNRIGPPEVGPAHQGFYLGPTILQCGRPPSHRPTCGYSAPSLAPWIDRHYNNYSSLLLLVPSRLVSPRPPPFGESLLDSLRRSDLQSPATAGRRLPSSSPSPMAAPLPHALLVPHRPLLPPSSSRRGPSSSSSSLVLLLARPARRGGAALVRPVAALGGGGDVGELFVRVEAFLYTVADAAVVAAAPAAEAAEGGAKEAAGDWLSGITGSMETVLKVRLNY